jgi:hypothetical protein
MLYILLIVLFSGCGVLSTLFDTDNVGNQLIDVGGSEAIIFSAENAEQLEYVEHVVSSNATGFWTPSVDQVLALEEQLPDYLRSALEDVDYPDREYYPDLWDHLDNYRRQYMGVFINEQQIIHGNFFCSEEDYWQEQLVFVLDGAACYFQVYYDVAIGDFFLLSMGGEG